MGQGNNAQSNQQPATAATTTPATTDNATGNAQGQQQQQPSAEEKRFTQAELEAQIKERLERQQRKLEADQKRAADDAEAKRLQENSQFKELSEKQAKDLLALTTEKETLTAQVAAMDTEIKQFKTLFDAQLAEQKKALPEPVVALLNKMPLAEQATWITENAAKLGVTTVPKGVPPTPRGEGDGAGNPVDAYISALNNKGQEKK